MRCTVVVDVLYVEKLLLVNRVYEKKGGRDTSKLKHATSKGKAYGRRLLELNNVRVRCLDEEGCKIFGGFHWRRD